jgi:transposase
MARYKHYDYSQMKLLPVNFEQQILPGTFEYTLNELIDNEIDLAVFEQRYHNDETGAPAYDPAILLKIILYAYSRGITQSREIARLCRENIVFMALSADTTPHFTTIADFISTLETEIVAVYRDVLLICDEAGLIGREMFAIDGVKLPSNASKEWSGTRADFEKKIDKMERAIKYLLKRHRATDAADQDESLKAARVKQIKTLKASVAKVKGFLEGRADKRGASGNLVKSNITDNESAKIKTGKGVIQGYDAMAVVDAQCQVIVGAQAFGAAQEHALLIPMLEHTRESFKSLGDYDVLKRAALLADSGLHSEVNLEYLFTHGIDGYVADTRFRKRDPRFATADRHRPTRPDAPWSRPKLRGLFTPKDFELDPEHRFCICPASKRLYRNGANVQIRGNVGVKFRSAKRDCKGCALRSRCMRNPDTSETRQVVFFLGRKDNRGPSHTAQMRQKIDSDVGRYRYSRRLGIVEPVFANITSAHRLRRFSMRGRSKVTTQWQLFCLVHNIGKIHRYGRRKRNKINVH